MQTATLVCPKCSAALTTSKLFNVGSRFRCPACGADFAVEEDDVPTMLAGVAPAPGVRPLPPADDAPRRSHGWLLLLGVVAVSLLLLVGAGAALALHFLLPKREAPPVAADLPPPAAPSDDEHPQPPPDDPTDLSQGNKPQKPRPKPLDVPPDPTPPQLAPNDPTPAAQSVLPPEEQKKVNAAIDRGVEFLKKDQKRNGSWAEAHSIGLAALPGLTLLECGVAADDHHVQKAAEHVRKGVPELTATYELALAILFLDRLGDPNDEPLIRTMALRLLAGQKPSGGWSYQCPKVSETDERNLWLVLEATRPHSSIDLVTTKNGDKGIDDLFSGQSSDKTVKPAGATIPLEPGPTEEDKKKVRKMYDGLTPALKDIPALKPPAKDDPTPDRDATDNSNTQFATLGLWAGGRHGVPMERALALLAKRFQVSQYASGGWSYHYPRGPAETATMTGAGLLGLAVGHGVTADLKGEDVEKAGEDPQVEKAMKALSESIGEQLGSKVRPRAARRSYYLLWSIERVGMLYGRKTIGGKEWYPWGAEDLVDAQETDGAWPNLLEAPTDSCFALLFLKRANLAKDLSTKLQFLTEIKRP